MKRVLMVLETELCIAGVPNVIMELVRALHDRYIFDVVTFSDKKGYYDEEFESYGGKIYPFSVMEYVGFKKLLYPYQFVQIKAQLKKLLKAVKYDIIHCHGGWYDGVCHAAAKKADVEIRISHAHGNYSGSRKNKMLELSREYGKILIERYATVRLACSETAGSTLYGNKEYCNVLNPVNTAYFSSIKKESHSGVGLLQIGYFCALKNQLFSVELLNYLRGQGVDARLCFIGFPYELEYPDRVKDRVKELALDKYVTFLPPDADKSLVLAKTDYSLLPSEREGLPLVALECQSAGVMCLMSDNVPRDADMGAARFLPHNDVEAWAKAVMENASIDYEKLEKKIAEVSCEAFAKKIEAFYH